MIYFLYSYYVHYLPLLETRYHWQGLGVDFRMDLNVCVCFVFIADPNTTEQQTLVLPYCTSISVIHGELTPWHLTHWYMTPQSIVTKWIDKAVLQHLHSLVTKIYVYLHALTKKGRVKVTVITLGFLDLWVSKYPTKRFFLMLIFAEIFQLLSFCTSKWPLTPYLFNHLSPEPGANP